jgi:hypothetical protein
MLERTIAFLGVQACAVAMTWAAWSDEVPDNYLPGTWAIGGVEACGGAEAEIITFDPDGTFAAAHGGQPTATGFWHLVEDVLDLHMVSSPAFFGNQLQPFAGQYTYYYAQALLFDIEDQAFRMVAYMGGQLRGANLARCP